MDGSAQVRSAQRRARLSVVLTVVVALIRLASLTLAVSVTVRPREPALRTIPRALDPSRRWIVLLVPPASLTVARASVTARAWRSSRPPTTSWRAATALTSSTYSCTH